MDFLERASFKSTLRNQANTTPAVSRPFAWVAWQVGDQLDCHIPRTATVHFPRAIFVTFRSA